MGERKTRGSRKLLLESSAPLRRALPAAAAGVGDDERGPGGASVLLGLPPRGVHLLGLDDDEALDLGEHAEQGGRGAVLDGAVAAAEAHGLERAAVEAARPREAPHQRDVQLGAPRHRHPRLERVERAPAHPLTLSPPCGGGGGGRNPRPVEEKASAGEDFAGGKKEGSLIGFVGWAASYNRPFDSMGPYVN